MDTITVIDFSRTVEDIKNLEVLPEPLKEEFLSSNSLRVSGFQEILGHTGEHGRQLLFSVGGYWSDDDKFTITSYGSKKYQWNDREPKSYKVTVE